MTKNIPTAAYIALLAPVPLVHLLDGQQKCDKEGRVAFGSQKFELFRQLDELRQEMPVDV